METIDDGLGGAHQVEAGINKTLATVVVVAAGVAIFEMALLPGLVLGVAAMAAPKYLPKLSEALGPAFKSTVRGARDALADAREHVADAKRLRRKRG